MTAAAAGAARDERAFERIATAADHIRALEGALEHRERVEGAIERRLLPVITTTTGGNE